jgi:hypothetical protein
MRAKGLTRALLHLRKHHPAWQLLSARTGPLVIGCLKGLFDENLNGIALDSAHQALSEVLQHYHEAGEIECDDDYLQEARREVRNWIRRGLVVERDDRLIATDALESAFRFVDGLDGRAMTSTASRLSIVQREIENLESGLDPDPRSREAALQRRIADLEAELAAVRRGEVEVLPEERAIEAVRELYTLAMSLRNDFRRVEDSYREADRRLRQSIVSEQSHRGEIVDSLLDSQAQLLQTDEGRVFDAFQQQLARQVELDAMQERIRALAKRPVVAKALSREQVAELRLLRMRLVAESGVVIRARQRSERDVKGFLKTGLASEHHRVGQLLNEILAQAALLDWRPQAVQRAPGPLPPVGVAVGTLPLLERLRVTDMKEEGRQALDLLEQGADLDDLDEEFWSAFDALDRQRLIGRTRDLLAEVAAPLSVGAIAARLQPDHDLEALALWLAMAREAEVPFGEEIEQVDLVTPQGGHRFTLPRVELSVAALAGVELEL